MGANKYRDVTLFSACGYIFGIGVVTYKTHHPELAEHLWGYNSNNETWEYVYFLDYIKEHRMPYLDFNRTVGYTDNFIIQGFTVLDEEKSEKVLSSFGLESEVYLADVPLEVYEEEILNYHGDLERDLQMV